MAKPVATIPPIVSINPANSNVRSTAFTEQGNQRPYGLFADLLPNGELRGVLELSGNITPFHTCCGGLRCSALVARYQRVDLWYSDGYFTQDYGDGQQERTWRWLRSNPGNLPTVASASSTEPGEMTPDNIVSWGRATLANHVKTQMAYTRRMLLVAMDRAGGHTIRTLASLKHLDEVQWTYPLYANVFNMNGARLRESTAPTTDVGMFRREITNGPVREHPILQARAYGAPLVVNLNSGNQLYNISVIPKLSPSEAKRKGAKQVRSLTTPKYAYAPLRAGDAMDSILSFYESQLLRKLSPNRLQQA